MSKDEIVYLIDRLSVIVKNLRETEEGAASTLGQKDFVIRVAGDKLYNIVKWLKERNDV